MTKLFPLQLILLWSLALFSGNAAAHAKSENYVWINVEQNEILGRFELNRNDVLSKLGIDLDSYGGSRLEAARATQSQVQAYLLENFEIRDEQGPMAIIFDDAEVFLEGERYIQYPYRTERLPVDNKVSIYSNIFLTPEMMADDRLHRSVIVVEYNKSEGQDFGAENVALIFSPDKTQLDLDLSAPPTILVWKDFLGQGLLHIAKGLDHVVFILLLLVTAVLKLDAGKWTPQPHFKSSLWKTLKLITMFTIAHSVTLSLAALGLVTINTALVETIIAVSIVVVALANIFPAYQRHHLWLIFLFGLFHGLGFASVMGDLQFRTVLIERILISFNIGVELGQLLIAVVVFPLLYLIRKHPLYQRGVVIPVSVLAACVGLYWTLERTGVLF